VCRERPDERSERAKYRGEIRVADEDPVVKISGGGESRGTAGERAPEVRNVATSEPWVVLGLEEHGRQRRPVYHLRSSAD
jgi:hypothetical protein